MLEGRKRKEVQFGEQNLYFLLINLIKLAYRNEMNAPLLHTEIKPIKRILVKKRPVGLAKKKYPEFELNDDFIDPLPDDLIDAFYAAHE